MFSRLYVWSQFCLTLCDSVDCSWPRSSVHGDSPGKNTGVGCYSSSRGSSSRRGQTWVSTTNASQGDSSPAKPSGVYQNSRLLEGKQVFSINHMICTTSSGTSRPSYQLGNSRSTPRSSSQMPAEGQPHSQPFPGWSGVCSVCPVTPTVLSGHLTEVLSPSVKLCFLPSCNSYAFCVEVFWDYKHLCFSVSVRVQGYFIWGYIFNF